MQSSPASAASSLLGPNILLSTLFSHTLNLYSALCVRDQVSHPYKKQVNYSFVCFNLCVSRQETGRQKISELNGTKGSLNLIS
jgi:hypothetical protein